MSYTFTDDVIDEVRFKNDIVDVISEYIDLKRAGANYKGLCPFHNEKTPSFIVSPSKQIFHCFGCGEGGDVISFIMKQQNLDFIESVKLLADRAGINIEDKINKIDEEKQKEKDEIYKVNRIAARYYYKNLFSDKNAQSYLLKRGIDSNTVKTFGLGYAKPKCDGLLNHLKSKGVSEQIILKAGLIIQRKDKSGYFDRFRGRIIYPIIDLKERVIGFGGRVLDNSQPKYLNSPDTIVFNKGYNLYGLNTARKYSNNRRILLVEGYMDVISLFKQGIKYGVASLGTALTSNQAKMLKRYGKEFYICYDSDKAGQNATDRALEILKKENIEAKVVMLTNSKDPDEFIKNNSKEDFENLINKALNYLDFKIELYKSKYNLNDLEGRIKFTTQIASVLRKIKSPVKIDGYIEKVAQESNISIEAIKDEVYGKKGKFARKTTSKDKYINGNYRYNNKDSITPVKYILEPGHLTAERCLLNLIITDKNNFNKLKENFKPEDFLDDFYREVAEVIYKEYDSKDEIYLEDIKYQFEQQKVNRVKELLNMELEFEDREKVKALTDYVNRIKYYKLKLKARQIKKHLEELELKKYKNEEDDEKISKLCMQLMDIEKQLKTS